MSTAIFALYQIGICHVKRLNPPYFSHKPNIRPRPLAPDRGGALTTQNRHRDNHPKSAHGRIVPAMTCQGCASARSPAFREPPPPSPHIRDRYEKSGLASCSIVSLIGSLLPMLEPLVEEIEKVVEPQIWVIKRDGHRRRRAGGVVTGGVVTGGVVTGGVVIGGVVASVVS